MCQKTELFGHDSAVSSLTIRVNNYAALKEMIRNSYGGRLVDVLEWRQHSYALVIEFSARLE